MVLAVLMVAAVAMMAVITVAVVLVAARHSWTVRGGDDPAKRIGVVIGIS